jgi:hypothetical protein
MDKEIAKLWLNTGSLTTTLSQTGIRSANQMSATFNFDLRIVLGETLWSKYKYFKVYIADTGNNTTGIGIATLYQNGLNLIQASYQGKPPGFQTAIDETNLITTAGFSPNQFNRSSNTHSFVMIKPDTKNVQLTLEWIDEAGATTAIVLQRAYFLAFVPIDDTKIYRSPYSMLYQNEQVNFTLSTKILTAGATNEYGTLNANRTVATFTNINMRHILGTLWDKYTKFNLIFNTIGIAANANPTGASRRMWWQVDGLQFINTLRVTNGYTQGQAFSSQLYYQTANQADAEFCEAPMSVTTFRKPESENVDLTFTTWVTANGGGLFSLSIGLTTFSFSIVGVKE